MKNLYSFLFFAIPALRAGATSLTGRLYVIKKISATGTVKVAGNSGVETIDGSTTDILSTQYGSIMIRSDGTGWYILSKN